VAIVDNHRTIVLGEVSWHFRQGRKLRPWFGVGAGAYREHRVVSCESQGCEAGLERVGLTPGESSAWTREVSFAAGLSVLVHPRIRARGGLRYHCNWHGGAVSGERMLSEVFVGVGIPIG
jgi:hypothetical protein